MPKFRDTVTGKILTFDHEPTQEELNAASSTGNVLPPQREDNSSGGVASGLGGLAGALIGGKTPLGKIGSGIGAAAGTAYGDLYDMFRGGPIPTMGDEASRLATVAGATSGLEFAVPPVLRAVGAVKNVIPRLGGVGGGGLLGYMFGHPGAGMAAGAALDAAPKIADGIDWLGTPYKATTPTTSATSLSPTEVASLSKQNYSPKVIDRIQGAIEKQGQPVQPAPQAEGPSLLDRGIGAVKSGASSALEGLKSGWNKLDSFMTTNPPPTGSPDTVKGAVDYAGQRASEIGAGGVPKGQAMKTAGREAGWPLGASSEKGPYSYPTFGGKDVPEFSLDDVHQTLKDFPEAFAKEPKMASQLTESAGPTNTSSAAVDGLERWTSSGGSPDKWRALLSDATPFGPNTVGAAQAKPGEFPTGWVKGMTPEDFQRLSIEDAERSNDPFKMDQIRAKISPLLDKLK